jgi:hypothetical protein
LTGSLPTEKTIGIVVVALWNRGTMPLATGSVTSAKTIGIVCVSRVQDRVAKRPRIAAYLASERRLPFNEQGIFWHYRELDA